MNDRPSRWLALSLAFLMISLAAAGLILAATLRAQSGSEVADQPITQTAPARPPTITPSPTPLDEPSPTPVAAGLPPTPTVAVPAVGIALLPGASHEAEGRALADALRAALQSAGLPPPVQVVDVSLPPRAQLVEQIEIERDAPGMLLLVVLAAPEGEPAAVSVLAPSAPPELAGLEDEIAAWEVIAPGPYPIQAGEGFTFHAELVAALLEANQGAGEQARVRLELLQGALLDAPIRAASSQTAALMFALGRAAETEGDLVEALQGYSQALRLDGGFTAARVARGNVYLRLGDAQAALAAYNPVLGEMPDWAELLYNRVLAHRLAGEQDAALEDAERLVALTPRAAWSLNLRGIVAYGRGDYRAALDDFSRVGELAPGEPIPLLNEALTLHALGDSGEALVAFDALVEMQPGNADYRVYLGQAFEAAGEMEQAARAYSEAIDLAPDHLEAHLRRGRVRLEADDVEGALADAQRSLELAPADARAYWLLGDALLAQESYADAERAYSAALDLGLQESAIYAGRGWAFQRLQYRAGAIADYERALALGERDPLVLRRMGFALFDAGRYADARDVLTSAVNQQPDNAEAHAGLALALDASVRREDAERQYQRALEIDPRYSRAGFLQEQPLWSQLAVNRAVTVLRRLGIDPYYSEQ